MDKVLFSGIAPSGNLTIGNFIGAIKQWKTLQHEYDSLFCIVDLHAITLPKDPAELREKAMDVLALYIACGLDPEISTVFVQSHNHHHSELCWILGCFTAYGDLSRMTQFKDKSSRQKYVPAGLFYYPVLMAADILLYRTALVPIGDDQRQHLELCRDIAKRFNTIYGDVFTIPSGFFPANGSRIKNLLDPAKKMDKSHENPRTYISLLDGDEEILSKIMKAKTDTRGDFPIDDEHEGIANLVTMMSALTETPKAEIADAYGSKGYGEFKAALAEVLMQVIGKIRDQYHRIRRDRDELEKITDMGKAKAIGKSEAVLRRVKEVVGLTGQ